MGDTGGICHSVQEELDAVESVDETLSAGTARLAASRRLLDDIERRLTRGSQLLGRDAGPAAERSSEDGPAR